MKILVRLVKSLFVLSATIVSLASCVTFPRFYPAYYPESDYGKPVAANGCGPVTALERKFDRVDVIVRVQKSAVDVAVSGRDVDIKLELNDVQLVNLDTQASYTPTNVTYFDITKAQNNYLLKEGVASYNIDSTIRHIEVRLPKSSIKAGGHSLPLTRYRFSYKTKFDFYYQSINC